MRQFLIGCLLGGLAAMAAPRVDAATASITFNGNTRTIVQTGFLFEQVSAVGVLLFPGESADFTFPYSISVQDTGAAAPFNPAGSGCVPLHVTSCEPPYTGFEVAKAELIAFYEDPRIDLHGVVQTGDATRLSIQTHGDSFADGVTQSGTIKVRLTNLDPVGTFTHVFATYVALWVLNPIPEPEIVAQLLAGLGVLGVAVRRRGRFGRR